MDCAKSNKITYERLIEILDYDPETGIFTWKVDKSLRAKKGSVAGCNIEGYISIGIDGKNYRASILAWLYTYKKYPEHKITHIDKNRKNNKIKNLRGKTKQGYIKKPKLKKDNKSGVNGIFFEERRNKWVAQIMVKRKNIYLGSFDKNNKDEAVKARYNAEIEYGYLDNYPMSQAYLYLKERGLV